MCEAWKFELSVDKVVYDFLRVEGAKRITYPQDTMVTNENKKFSSLNENENEKTVTFSIWEPTPSSLYIVWRQCWLNGCFKGSTSTARTMHILYS